MKLQQNTHTSDSSEVGMKTFTNINHGFTTKKTNRIYYYSWTAVIIVEPLYCSNINLQKKYVYHNKTMGNFGKHTWTNKHKHEKIKKQSFHQDLSTLHVFWSSIYFILLSTDAIQNHLTSSHSREDLNGQSFVQFHPHTTILIFYLWIL